MKTIKFSYIVMLLLAVPMLFVGCSKDSLRTGEDAGTSSNGVAGSYARILTVGDFMYIVDNTSIQTYSLADATTPSKVDDQEIGQNIESIFHLDGKLFIGSNLGMYLYAISADGSPEQVGQVQHDILFNPCTSDPVVSDGDYAYVTLNTDLNGPCGQTSLVNQLSIYNVQNINNPTLVAEYEMYNPKGVGVDGDILFLCDNEAGLKIFNVANPTNIQMIAHFDDITTYDVIPLNGLLLVVGPRNLYQFDYTDLDNIHKVSEMVIAS